MIKTFASIWILNPSQNTISKFNVASHVLIFPILMHILKF